MGWIEDAAENAKWEDEDRERRENAFYEGTQRLWGGLVHRLQDDMKGINQNQELLRRRLGGELLRVEGIPDGLRVSKITYPAVYLDVRFDGKRIIVERQIVTNGQDRRTRTEREQINFEVDDKYELHMKNDSEVRLGVAEASRYLLTPLLSTHKLKEGS